MVTVESLPRPPSPSLPLFAKGTSDNGSRSCRSFNASVHGLRGLAALSVFVYHTIYQLQFTAPFPVVLDATLGSLRCGVQIFFMISGYLITGSIIRHANVRAFLLDRVARIYPVFLFIHVLLFVMAPVMEKWVLQQGLGMWFVHFFCNLFFLSTLFKMRLLQPYAWTLTLEAIFYLVCAAVYGFWPRMRSLAVLILLVAPVGLVIYYPPFIFFGVGVAIFFMVHRTERDRSSGLPHLGLIGFPIFVAIIGYALLPGHLWTSLAAVPFGFAFFLDVVRQTPLISAFLCSRFMQFFGTISYSLYLWHPVVTIPVRHIAAKILIAHFGMSVTEASVFLLVTVVAITLPVSWLSWRFLEVEGGKWAKGKFKRFEGRAIQPTAG
jgi:peptidoglycan/LPS O-acetylase OafA/YrhL